MRTRVAVAACLLPLAVVSPAAADAPTRTGWWNSATVNGTALPQPTTGADDLHVGQGPEGPTAYAAVALDLAADVPGGVLKLAVVEGSAVGTADVQACPTKDLTWKAGGNQPYDTRPEYDCASAARGVPAADGNAVVFVLDAAQQLGGGYSVAIVPVEGAAPFQVDFAEPGPEAFTPDPPAVVDEPPPAPVAPTPDDASPATVAAAPTFEAAPVEVGGAPTAPLLPTPAPMAAAAPVAPVAAAPVALVPMRPQPVSNRDRYAAGTMLALLTGALVWAFQQPTPAPRLIGGAARSGAPAPAPPPAETRPRGIGRFAAIRTAPARRLV